MPDPEKTTQYKDTLTLWPLPDVKHVYLLAAGIFLGVMLGPAVLGRVMPAQYEQWFNAGGDTTQLDQAHAEALELMEKPESYLLPPDIDAEITRYETLAYAAMDARLETMRDIEVTPQAIEEERQQSQDTIRGHRDAVTQRAFDTRRNELLLQIAGLERKQAETRHAHRLKLIGIQMALILALVAFAIAEALLAPTPAPGSGDSEEAGGEPAGASKAAAVSPRLAHLVTVRYALLAGWLTLAIAQPAAIKAVSPVFAVLLVAVVLVAGFVPLGKKTV